MDITGIFHQRLLDNSADGAAGSSGRASATAPPSPSLLMAADINRQIQRMHACVHRISSRYVEHNRLLPNLPAAAGMTGDERATLDSEIAAFMSTCASSIQSLRIHCGSSTSHSRSSSSNNNNSNGCTSNNSSSSSSLQHYDEVAAFLSERLRRLGKRCQAMKQERATCGRSPFRLLTSANTATSAAADRIPSGGVPAVDVAAGTGPSGSVAAVESPAAEAVHMSAAGASLVERYEAEVAPPSVMREYAALAARHKSDLLRETTLIRAQFGTQLDVAARMEGTVEGISAMLTDFLHIIDAQAPTVEGVRDSAKEATEAVQKTNKELELTITRTESYQTSMVALILGAALLLLLLDYVTP